MDTLCKDEYQPTVVITDQGHTEINAIRSAFSFDVRIFYCAWHVLMAWEKNLTEKNLGTRDLPTPEKLRKKHQARLYND
ncbi:hypothetical protein BGZ72_003980, partial [Mortierella alpina]